MNPANPQSWNAYAYVANQPLTATDPLGLGVCQGAPLPGEPVPDGPVQFDCPSQGFVGGNLSQTFTVSATPEAAPAPMWEMACGPACISGAVEDAVASLQAAVNSFVNEMSSHPTGPGGGGSGGSVAGSVAISGPADRSAWDGNRQALATLAQVGQLRAPWVSGGFLLKWDLSATAVALLGPEAGPAWDSLSSVAQTARGLAQAGAGSLWASGFAFAATHQAWTNAAQDFTAGWGGQYAPTRAGAAGAAAGNIYNAVTCPPWSGQCG